MSEITRLSAELTTAHNKWIARRCACVTAFHATCVVCFAVDTEMCKLEDQFQEKSFRLEQYE